MSPAPPLPSTLPSQVSECLCEREAKSLRDAGNEASEGPGKAQSQHDLLPMRIGGQALSMLNAN